MDSDDDIITAITIVEVFIRPVVGGSRSEVMKSMKAVVDIVDVVCLSDPLSTSELESIKEVLMSVDIFSD